MNNTVIFPYNSNFPYRPKPKEPTELDLLFDLAGEFRPFATEFGQAWVSVPLGERGHQVMPLRSPWFREWFWREYRLRHARPRPKPHNLRTVIRTLEAQAFAGPASERPVATRFTAFGWRRGPAMTEPSEAFLDLPNRHGEVITITPEGWSVTPGLHVSFHRPRAMQPLPKPEKPADPTHLLARLRALLNPATERDWRRCLAWLVSALHPAGPYPILVLHGPAESGKSTAARLLRSLLDPSWTPCRPLPRTDRQFLDLAFHNHIVAIDEVQRLSAKTVHRLTQLSSGASFSFKERGDDREPIPIFLRRPAILVLDRPPAHPSLAARSLTVQTKAFTADTRRLEPDVWQEFTTLHAQLLGLICDAVSAALRNLPNIKPPSLPRLADAALWAAAAAEVFGLTPEDLLAAFDPDDPEPTPQPQQNNPDITNVQLSPAPETTSPAHASPPAASPSLSPPRQDLSIQFSRVTPAKASPAYNEQMPVPVMRPRAMRPPRRRTAR